MHDDDRFVKTERQETTASRRETTFAPGPASLSSADTFLQHPHPLAYAYEPMGPASFIHSTNYKWCDSLVGVREVVLLDSLIASIHIAHTPHTRTRPLGRGASHS